MKLFHLAALLCSVMAFGLVALQAAPDHTAGLFTDAAPNGANAFATATLQPATGLAAVSNGADQIDLSWTASASGFAEGYNVYRSTTDGSGHALIAFVAGGGSTVHPDPALPAATTYYYIVETVYQNWSSAASNQASAATP
jgi:hypothetical protein